MTKIFYKTIAQHYEYEIPKIKGSRFIGNVFHVESKEEAEKYLQEIKKKYHDATHNCYAYICGTKVNYDLFDKLEITPEYMKQSDEGEPANTAGKPILAQIQGHELYNVLVVVTRYFGGILLGIGGLIQAYSNCAKQVIEKSNIVEKEITTRIQFTYNFEFTPLVKNIISMYNAKILQENYNEKGEIHIDLNIGYLETFKTKIYELSKGSIIIN